MPSHASRRSPLRLRHRPAGNNAGDTVWLFDLDNTLHDASHAIFPAINAAMTAYVARVLACDEASASRVRVDYWKRYGATLLGMIRHHGVDPADFLRAAHEFPDIARMVRVRRGLAAQLRRLPGRKVLLTNAPQDYARAVMRVAGIEHCFERVIAIEQMWVHGDLRPKPDRRMLRRLLSRLRIAPGRAVLVEDTVSHLKRYAGLGIRTAWITGYLRSMTPSRPHDVPAGAARDAAQQAALRAEAERHPHDRDADRAAREEAVTLVAAENQAGASRLSPEAQQVDGYVAGGAAGTAGGTAAGHATRDRAGDRTPNRARMVHRPGYVDIKVQSVHQLHRRMRRNGS